MSDNTEVQAKAITREEVADLVLAALRGDTASKSVSSRTSLKTLFRTSHSLDAFFNTISNNVLLLHGLPLLPPRKAGPLTTVSDLIDAIFLRVQHQEARLRTPKERKLKRRRKFAAQRRTLSKGREDETVTLSGKLATTAPGAGEQGGAWMVPVYYATNRKPTGNAAPNKFYGVKRADQLQFGVVTVSIPRGHDIGELERPRWWRLEFHEDPKGHIVLNKIEPKAEAAFLAEVKSSVENSLEKGLFILIHGYNVSFAAAARRAAQMAFDLFLIGRNQDTAKLSWVPMLFSWPSHGEALPYVADSANAQQSAELLKQFLLTVSRDSGAKSITVIAHSMGNQPLIAALKEIGMTMRSRGKPLINQIILAAADIDKDVFLQAAPHVKRTGRRVTIYASNRDKALLGSRKLHAYPRLGDTHGGITIVEGCDSIDASEAGDDMLAHSYMGETILLSDIHSLVTKGAPPSQRFGLLAQGEPPKQHWLLRARS